MTTGSEVSAVHYDCVVCRARTSEETPETATLVLLVILHDDLTLEDVYQDLCFFHRRKVDSTVQTARAERAQEGSE